MVDVNDAVLDGKAELFFPAYLIPSLRDLRGDSWRELGRSSFDVVRYAPG